jgi:hypothetical protein
MCLFPLFIAINAGSVRAYWRAYDGLAGKRECEAPEARTALIRNGRAARVLSMTHAVC